jgi:hypothetical protein
MTYAYPAPPCPSCEAADLPSDHAADSHFVTVSTYSRIAGSGDKLVPAKDCPRKGCDGGLIVNREGDLDTCPRCKGVGMVRA